MRIGVRIGGKERDEKPHATGEYVGQDLIFKREEAELEQEAPYM